MVYCCKKNIFLLQKASGEREELGEFLYTYLQRRFGVENMIVEWGYNLQDACARYSHDPRIALFSSILQKEVCSPAKYCNLAKADILILQMCLLAYILSWFSFFFYFWPHLSKFWNCRSLFRWATRFGETPLLAVGETYI